MNPTWQAALWGQFGAAIDTLEKAIEACPDSLWADRSRRPEFWYLVYHTLIFLDVYLSESEEAFVPPAPFTRDELEAEVVLPERAYTKDELRTYLATGREKCRRTLAEMTDDQAARPCGFPGRDFSVAELQIYNLRHVQHHAAQLNLLLRQTVNDAPLWVSRNRRPLEAGG